jgi:hypothetical protein
MIIALSCIGKAYSESYYSGGLIWTQCDWNIFYFGNIPTNCDSRGDCYNNGVDVVMTAYGAGGCDGVNGHTIYYNTGSWPGAGSTNCNGQDLVSNPNSIFTNNDGNGIWSVLVNTNSLTCDFVAIRSDPYNNIAGGGGFLTPVTSGEALWESVNTYGGWECLDYTGSEALVGVAAYCWGEGVISPTCSPSPCWTQ